MGLDPALAPVRLSVDVGCSVEDAFALFTTRMAEWWPLDIASYGGHRAKEIFLEPRVGGRFYERFVDGDELQVGRVIVCTPPERIVFTWSTADWDGETEVDVTFHGSGDTTSVEIEHRGFERLGRLGPDVAAKFRGGWPTVLNAFATARSRRDAGEERGRS